MQKNVDMKKIFKNLIIALALLSMLCLSAPAAHGLAVDPAQDFSLLRVGLVFGDEAVDSGEFKSIGGAPFMLGQYNADREFNCELETQASGITVALYDGLIHVLDAYTGALLCTVNGSSIALVPAEPGLTEYGGRQYHGGFCCLIEENGLSVINYVGLEDYVKGVVPYEMSASWGIEALKAQAVCARTYAVFNQGEYEEFGFDIRDDTYSQVYNGVLEATEETDRAVDETAGELIRYNGEVCEIYYFAADGGATEDGINVFDADRPYLRGKYDHYERLVDFSVKNWTAHRSGAEIGEILREKGYDVGDIARIERIRSRTGNNIALNFFDDEGNSAHVAGRSCYNMLRLNSCRFSIVPVGDGFDFLGHGWGHNCGMSQWGAKAMAEVYGYDYEKIIKFYFTGVYIA